MKANVNWVMIRRVLDLLTIKLHWRECLVNPIGPVSSNQPFSPNCKRVCLFFFTAVVKGILVIKGVNSSKYEKNLKVLFVLVK